MEKLSMTRKEVEEKLVGVGDYVKMDFLQQCLKKQLDFDTKKFVLTNLSKIYESRKMYLEAGKMIRIAADINTTYEGKMNDFVKSSELFINGGNYGEADISLNKSFGLANENQKISIKNRIKEAYKNRAKELLSKDKRRNAAEAYEKILTLDLNPLEKNESRQKLLELYGKLGKIKEFYALKNFV